MLRSELAVALVGCGYFSRHHREAWARTARCRLVAVVDADPARAEAAARGLPGVRAFADVEAMLRRARPDVVDIVTPEETHAAIAAAAARAGVAAICQKPLAPTLDEARRMVEAAERAGAPLIVHENFRFRPWFAETARLVAAGALGAPAHIAFRLRTGDGRGPEPYPDQPYFRNLPRFLVHETGVHFVDVFRAIFGEIVAVQASLRRRNPVIAGEDAALVLFEFASGATGVFDGDRLGDHPAGDPRVTLGVMLAEGAEAQLRLDGEGRLFLRPLGGEERAHPYDVPAIGYRGDSVGAQIRHIAAHLLDGAPVVNDGRAYLRNIEIVEAIYAAAEQGARIRLPQP